MYSGTNGHCIENCGDGRNFNLLSCDDKNNKDGDGCSKDCKAEPDYFCFGGTNESRDRCTYVPTEITGAAINDHNNIILNFSRPVNITNDVLTLKDLLLSYRNQFGDE